jgi:polar amino acid transport system substrate-binding protein
MSRRLIASLLALVLLLSLGLAGCQKKAAADDSWTKIKEKGVLVLGLDDAFPPMGFRDDKNNLVGFDIDLATEVCKRLGLTLKLQPIDWSQKINELNTGLVDCLWNGFTITTDRQKELSITTPYMKNRQVLVVLASSAYKTKADLAGKKLAVQAESSAVEALTTAAEFKKSLKEVVELDDNVTALMDLEAKTTDVVLMDEIVANYYIQKKGAGYRVLTESLAEEDYGVGFRKADQALRDKVQETLAAMAKDGKLAEISKTWFGKDVTTISK